ncbi:uncharacterized protein [Cicer arietinum]|uniref:Uncharacterized protein LOC101491315 n=1 Tax=Cicer arietinum TaxID=3827 RepID=A0A1S2Z0K5_CICAR|nr:uncharacterized protein LOC101491315 [Cicer arietinum]
MLGTALQYGGEDQFYIPMKARKNQNQRKKTQKDKSEDSVSKSDFVDSENRNLNESSCCPSVELGSNIDRFLESTTPLVPAQYFSKTTIRGWKTCDVEYQSYFTLNYLWESFKEWSAYGAGVPLLLDQRESVVQYYVPYLSAIQLYGQSAKNSISKPRYIGEDSDGDYYRDSSSDGSSDSEFKKRTENSTSQRSNQHRTGDDASLQDLLFEYFDQDPPYSREPLSDKILDLARHYPSLKSLRSCDLLPASWLSVAWYPIYRIPTGPTLKDLDACFLTYHTLHTPLTGNAGTQAPILVYPNDIDGVPNISLPTFAMASYKLKRSIWMQNGVSDNQLSNSLLQAADNWLRLVQVHHPDYQFFVSHGIP